MALRSAMCSGPTPYFSLTAASSKSIVSLKALARFRIEHFHMGRDQLHGIGIAGNDDGLHALLAGLLAQRAQDIIGFVLFYFEKGDAEGLHQLLHPLDLT